jgi:hypothetical protein
MLASTISTSILDGSSICGSWVERAVHGSRSGRAAKRGSGPRVAMSIRSVHELLLLDSGNVWILRNIVAARPLCRILAHPPRQQRVIISVLVLGQCRHRRNIWNSSGYPNRTSRPEKCSTASTLLSDGPSADNGDLCGHVALFLFQQFSIV